MIAFPPFKLDLAEERLWRGAAEIEIRRKPFAILKYLASNPKRLVTHAELLEHVWGGTVVSESTVRTQLHELRRLLGEGVIETVIGRGYRFTAAVATEDAPLPEVTLASDRIVVGRAAELAALRAGLERAHTGHRQVCFVTGEPGIGKTTLVDSFLEQLPASVIAVRGQCIEQHGTPEPYLAITEIVSRLREGPLGQRTLEELTRFAPMFLSQLPHLIPEAQLDEVRNRARGGSAARMVRELIEALEALASQHTLVLVLEDLQWSDVATLDLLAVLGARRERARLLAICTSRRVEANTVSHPLNPVMRTLIARSGAKAIPLDRVALPDIRELLALRFPGHAFPEELAVAVDRITAGTPLFVVSVLDDLVARDMLSQQGGGWVLTASLDDVRAHRPESVKQLIDIRLDRLAPVEQRVLEAASIIGQELSCRLVAAALEHTVEQVDEACDALARRSLFLRREATETWPDGTQHARYAVTHGLVQEVCLGRSSPARQQRWHRLVAEHLEASYGDRASEIAHTLATHFERGQHPARAVHYYLVAGTRTAERFASHDALVLYRRGLDLLKRTPATRERDAAELRLLGGVVASTLRTSDPSSSEPVEQLTRMIELARALGDAPHLVSTLLNLAFRYQLVADHARGLQIFAEVEQVIATAQLHPALVDFARAMQALNAMWLGRLAGVAQVFEGLLAAGDTLEELSLGILGPTDRRTVLTCYAATVHWLGGEAERALAGANEALAMARATKDPFGLGFTMCSLGWLHAMRGDAGAQIAALARGVLEIPDADVWYPTARILEGSVTADAAAAEALTDQFLSLIPTIPLGTTRLGIVVVEMLRRTGQHARARDVVADLIDFASTHDERVVEAELVRLAGELVEPTDPAAAKAHYLRACAIAEATGARILEHRARERLAQLTSSSSPS